MARARTARSTPKKRRSAWLLIAVIVGVLTAGGVLGRAGVSVLAIAVLLVFAIAVLALVKGAIPLLGMRSRKSGFAALGTAVLLLVGGAATAAPASDSFDAPSARLQAEGIPAAKPSEKVRTPSPTPTPIPTTFEVVEVDSTIPFERTVTDDPSIAEGTTAITTAGANGTLRTTYRVTYVDGAEVSREMVRETVATAPVTEVTTRGTLKPQPAPKPVPLVQAGAGCDSNYAGACVPIASDVDCAGGSGNGPAYLSGSAQVVGTDVYDLDRDSNGIACD